MTTRLDLTIQKHPDHEEAIRLLASRDPSGNLKYLDWQAKVLVGGQALAPEIADVIDLFHKYNGRYFGDRREQRIRPDIYSYQPKDLSSLRGALLKLQRAQDKKRKKREKLYRIEGAVEADVVYDSSDLIVRHIKNKQASVHYGLSTKWCIAMKRENYFEDYETQNATFFFFERKTPKGDEFDKSAVMIVRSHSEGASCFTALDERVDLLTLPKAYGVQVFDVFRLIYERSEDYPGSVATCVFAGRATAEQLEQAFSTILDRDAFDVVDRFIEAICCNDAAPWPLLERIMNGVESISREAWKRYAAQQAAQRRRGRYGRRRYYPRDMNDRVRKLTRAIQAALSIHPNVPVEVREKLDKKLRQRHVNTSSIHIDRERDGICIAYRMRGEREFLRLRHYRVRRRSMSQLVCQIRGYKRMIKRTERRIREMEQKKRKKAARKK